MNTNANHQNGFTKIRCTDMVPGAKYALALYNAKELILSGTCISRPSVPVLAMTKDDRYVMDINGQKIEFFKNASPPHYLETRIKTARGTMKNTRVIFYAIDEVTAKSVYAIVNGTEEKIEILMLGAPVAKKMKLRGHPVQTPDIIYMGSEKEVVVNIKPVRLEGENFGQFMKRLNMWKKDQAAIAA